MKTVVSRDSVLIVSVSAVVIAAMIVSGSLAPLWLLAIAVWLVLA